MPRTSTATSRAASIPAQTLVVDNGGYSIKAGLVSSSTADPAPTTCHVIPNCIAKSNRDRRTYISSQLDACRDFGALQFRRPVEKGYVVNWDGERAIWEFEFGEKGRLKGLEPKNVNLLLSEAPNAPQRVQEMSDQIVFEEFGFSSAYRSIAPAFNAYNDIVALFGDQPSATPSMPVEILMVVDAGYSHTTVTPLLKGRPIQSAIRRITVGGKFMTNYLKELLSIRHYSLMDETYLVNEIKEAVSFVSSDFKGDLDRTWKHQTKPPQDNEDIRVDYLLPDYESRIRGEMRPHEPRPAKRTLVPGQKREEILTLGNERFSVPELLFNPTDIGLKEAGVPEVIMQSLATLPRGLWPGLLANVVVVGGNASIPGFVERLESELRMIAPVEFPVRVKGSENPTTYTWQGAARLAKNKELLKGKVVTKEEYAEHGSAWVARKFAGTV